MKQFTENQKKIIYKANTILEYINSVNDWISIANACCQCKMDNHEEKLEKILKIALKETKKLYDFSDEFWRDLGSIE